MTSDQTVEQGHPAVVIADRTRLVRAA